MDSIKILTPDMEQERLKEEGLFYKKDLSDQNISAEIIGLISPQIAEKYQIIPLEFTNDGMFILVTHDNSLAFKQSNDIRQSLNGKQIKLLFAEVDNVRAALLTYYHIDGRSYGNRSNQIADIDTSPLKRSVTNMIQNAAERRASDIHLLPYEEGVYVYFRINGHLIDFTNEYEFNADQSKLIVNIIKSMDTSRQANISVSNMPNNGSFIITRAGRPIDVRLSTMPMAHGGFQKVNLRLLPQTKKKITLKELYGGKDLFAIKKALLGNASGMFLNSGPTGSGKTTSLYAQIYDVLDIFNEPLNIMTIEDPVEMHEQTFCQVQVKEAQDEAINLTAPKILKADLRQDPDIILYGEIRDKKDAEVAIEAATTGHKVFSTVHAKDCIATIARLLDLGVSRASLLREINIIISQRLVALLCPKCSVPHSLTKGEIAILSDEDLKILSGKELKSRASKESYSKCDCSYGYVQRVAVPEYIIFDMEIRDLLLRDVTFSDIQAILKKKQFCSMWDKGLALVASGETDLKEILRVIGK